MATVEAKKNKGAAFAMKMPDWFIDELSVDAKKALINRIKTKPVNFRELSYDQLRKKEFWVKDPSP